MLERHQYSTYLGTYDDHFPEYFGREATGRHKNDCKLNKIIKQYENMNQQNTEKSWNKKPCQHPSHKPPGHMVIRPGTTFVHTCPCCGSTTKIHKTETWC